MPVEPCARWRVLLTLFPLLCSATTPVIMHLSLPLVFVLSNVHHAPLCPVLFICSVASLLFCLSVTQHCMYLSLTLFSHARWLHVFLFFLVCSCMSAVCCADVLEISTDLLKQAYEMQIHDYTRFLKSTRLFSMMSEAQVILRQTR